MTNTVIAEEQALTTQPSLSIHSRGYYDHGKGASLSLQCAKSLLVQGVIKKVFFSTDSENLDIMARSMIDRDVLVITNKTLSGENLESGKSMDNVHRNEMDSAVRDWHLLGITTYCMSPTMDASTFSQSALAHGDCKYIPQSRMGKDHKFNNVTCSSSIKDIDVKPFFKFIEYRHEDKLGTTLNDDMRNKIWEGIEKEVLQMDFPCTPSHISPFSHIDSIRKFWATREKCIPVAKIPSEYFSNTTK